MMAVPMPRKYPITALRPLTIPASVRIILRMWACLKPMARKTPISLVLSFTEDIMVVVIIREAMIIITRVTTTENLLNLSTSSCLASAASLTTLTLAPGTFLAISADMAAAACSSLTVVISIKL